MRFQASGFKGINLFRLYLSLVLLASWYIGLTEPQSMINLIAQHPSGSLILYLMLAVGLVGVADWAINDLLCERYSWQMAVNHRHFVFAAMAFCYVAQLFAAVNYVRSTGLLLYYLLNASVCMYLAMLDASQRRKVATSCLIHAGS